MRARKLDQNFPDAGEFFALGTDLLDDLTDPPTFEALIEATDHLFESNELGARAAFLTAVAARRVWLPREHDEIREIYVRWSLGQAKPWD
jgi:hypothetical protein